MPYDWALVYTFKPQSSKRLFEKEFRRISLYKSPMDNGLYS